MVPKHKSRLTHLQALLLALAATPISAQNTTILLYDVTRPSPTPVSASQLFEPIGVGAGGATTYRNEVYVSGSVARETTTFTSGGAVVTRTGPDTTSTVFATLVADASHFVYSHIPPEPTNPAEPDAFPPQILNCTLHNPNKGGDGVCEIRWWEQGGRATETFTSTFTGHAVPLYTLTASLPATTSNTTLPTNTSVPANSTSPPTGTTSNVPETGETGTPSQNGATQADRWGVRSLCGAAGIVIGTLGIFEL